MPKGEKSTKDSPGAQALNRTVKAYSEEIAGLKALTEERKRRRKYTQEGVAAAYEAVSQYAEDCYIKKQPLTVAGMMLAVGMQRDAWSRANSGDLDYLLEEYLIDHNIEEKQIRFDDDGLPWFDSENGPVLLLRWSDLRKKADLLIQDQLERNCYTNRGNPAGSIFGLKAQFNWQEDSVARGKSVPIPN